jgi:hypothetical protein
MRQLFTSLAVILGTILALRMVIAALLGRPIETVFEIDSLLCMTLAAAAISFGVSRLIVSTK